MAKKQGGKSSKSIDNTKNLLVIIGLLLVALALVSVLCLQKAKNEHEQAAAQKGSFVSLGAMEYDFSSGKAVKKNDQNIASLRSFLEAEGEKNVGPNCETVYHNVVVASPDEKQVLLAYGCSHPGARMFAVQEDGKWKILSPTNQFDLLGIPLCEYVDSNNIDRSIAPVCAKPSPAGSELSYTVR